METGTTDRESVLRTPTFSELLSAYERAAELERRRYGKPCERRQKDVVSAVRSLLSRLGIPMDASTDSVSVDMLDDFVANAHGHGLMPISAWSYVESLRAVTAWWTTRYYEAEGIRARFDIPRCRTRAPAYVHKDDGVRHAVLEWYGSLWDRPDPRPWMIATLMLEFGMRNGDVTRLKWTAFQSRGGGMYLCYTPNKTRLSSGRTISWPVHASTWGRIADYRDRLKSMPRKTWSKNAARDSELVVPVARDLFRPMNAELRSAAGFSGSKGLYELRKLCVDSVYVRYGAEMASSISGDDLRTVLRHYADPSAVHVDGGLSVADMLGHGLSAVTRGASACGSHWPGRGIGGA